MFKNKPIRIHLPGYVYFVTSKTFKNNPTLKGKHNAEIFFNTLKFLKQRKDFEVFVVILLPDHFHLLVKPINKNISEIVHNLKSYTTTKISEQILSRRGVEMDGRGVEASPMGDKNFSHKYRQGFHALPPQSKRKTISIKIWQRSFYYHLILSEKDFENHFNYIYYNAVKHGYVSEPEDWPYLLFNYDVEL